MLHLTEMLPNPYGRHAKSHAERAEWMKEFCEEAFPQKRICWLAHVRHYQIHGIQCQQRKNTSNRVLCPLQVRYIRMK